MRRRKNPFAPEAPARAGGKRTWLLAGGGVLMATTLAFGLGHITATEDNQAPRPTTSAEATPGTLPHQDARLSVAELTWREHTGVHLPFHHLHGPSKDADGWVRGFTRSEAGAVLAAAHIFFQADRTADLPREAILASLENQWTGDHANQRVEAVRELGIEPAPDRSRLAVRGYLVHEYSSSGAVIELAIDAADSQGDGRPVTSGWLLTLLWEGGDWKRLMPENDMDHVRLLSEEEMEALGFTEFNDE